MYLYAIDIMSTFIVNINSYSVLRFNILIHMFILQLFILREGTGLGARAGNWSDLTIPFVLFISLHFLVLKQCLRFCLHD